MSVTIVSERFEVQLDPIITSDKRRVHGSELLLYPSPNTFEVRNEAHHTVDLRCGAALVRVPGANRLTLQLRRNAGGGAQLHPLASVGFVLMARHCKSDHGDEVCHTYAYGQVLVSELVRGGTVEVVLYDRPAEFENVYAQSVVASRKGRSNGVEDQVDKVVQLASRHKSRYAHQFFERAWVRFVNVRVEFQHAVSLEWPLVAADAAMLSPRTYQFLGTDARARSARARLDACLTDHRIRTYHPYGGEQRFGGWKAMDRDWESYFVPSYRMGCGVDMPSSLAVSCTTFSKEPDERLYSQLFRAQLTVNGVSAEEVTDACRGILAAHSTWVAQASVSGVPVDQNDDPRFVGKRGITSAEDHALNMMVSALTSMSNALCYTTDFAEMEDKSAAEEIVTEQFETAPLRTRALDCEDGAAWVLRLWISLVTHIGTWQDPVVALAARVLDLYVVTVNKMHCGECHILATFLLRDYAYATMMSGFEVAVSAGVYGSDVREHARWATGIERTVFWPAYMYVGGEPGSLQHRRDLHQHLVHGRGVQWPLPPVLVAESTRVAPPDQRPVDVHYAVDRDEMARRVSVRYMEVDALHKVCESVEELCEWTPHTMYPANMTRAAASAQPKKLSGFYRGFIVGSMVCPKYIQLHRESQRQCYAAQIDLGAVLEHMDDAHWFVDFVHHDRASARTFGVYHAAVMSNAPSVAMFPYAPIDLETMLWVDAVRGVEEPVLPGVLPAHLHGLHYSELGRAEPIPQLARHPGLLAHFERAQQTVSDVPTLELAFGPTDHVLNTHDLALLLNRLPRALQGARLRAMRIALVEAPLAQPPPHPEEVRTLLARMRTDLGIADLDVVEMTEMLDKQVLDDMARARGVFERYTTEQWATLRHDMGRQVRRRPIYLRRVSLVLDV